jgi:hypothetical protein
VIGILIALQINNWNEHNKSKAKEVEMLNDFKIGLEVDLIGINKAIKISGLYKSSMVIILAHLETDLPYSDSLKSHFAKTTGIWTSDINGSVFESLKSEGLALISNKELRKELVELYENLSISQQKQNDRYRDLIDESSANILNTRFDEFWKGNHESWADENDFADKIHYSSDGLISEMTPIDYEKLKNDQEYLYFLSSLKNRHFWHIEIWHKSVKKLSLVY